MRRYIKESGKDLPGWKKRRTERPTSFMMVTKFSGVMILKIGKFRQFNKPLTPQQKEYLTALGLIEDIFIKNMVAQIMEMKNHLIYIRK